MGLEMDPCCRAGILGQLLLWPCAMVLISWLVCVLVRVLWLAVLVLGRLLGSPLAVFSLVVVLIAVVMVGVGGLTGAASIVTVGGVVLAA